MSDFNWFDKLKIGDKFIYGESSKSSVAIIDKIDFDGQIYATLQEHDNWIKLGSISFGYLAQCVERASRAVNSFVWIRPFNPSFSYDIKNFLLNNCKISFKEHLKNV